MDEHIYAEMESFRGQRMTDSFRLDTRLAVNVLKDLCAGSLRETTEFYCLLDGRYAEYIGAVNRDGRIEYVVPLPRGKFETPTFTGGLEEYEELHKQYDASVRKERNFLVVSLLILLGFSVLWFVVGVKG